jgi:predicted ester cyclase
MTAADLTELASRYYELFNQRRFDEAQALVDPQAIFTYLQAREHLIGRAGYRELVRRWVEAFPDASLSIVSVRVFDDTVRTDWIGDGTQTGPLELPGLPVIAPNGQHAQLPMRETIRIVNNLIVESRMEFDPQELRRRLGV